MTSTESMDDLWIRAVLLTNCPGAEARAAVESLGLAVLLHCHAGGGVGAGVKGSRHWLQAGGAPSQG